MKPFVILISPSNMEEAIQKFKEAGFDEFDNCGLFGDTYDCIGTVYADIFSGCGFDKWAYNEDDFRGCRHFEESQIDECIKWLGEV